MFACVMLLSEANLPSGSRRPTFRHISLLVSPVVSVVFLAVCVHERGGCIDLEGTLQGGLAVDFKYQHSSFRIVYSIFNTVVVDCGSCYQVCFIECNQLGEMDLHCSFVSSAVWSISRCLIED